MTEAVWQSLIASKTHVALSLVAATVIIALCATFVVRLSLSRVRGKTDNTTNFKASRDGVAVRSAGAGGGLAVATVVCAAGAVWVAPGGLEQDANGFRVTHIWEEPKPRSQTLERKLAADSISFIEVASWQQNLDELSTTQQLSKEDVDKIWETFRASSAVKTFGTRATFARVNVAAFDSELKAKGLTEAELKLVQQALEASIEHKENLSHLQE